MKFPVWAVRISMSCNRVLTGNKQKSMCASLWHWSIVSVNRESSVFVVRVVDALFWFDKGHCKNAYMKWVRSIKNKDNENRNTKEE